MMRILKEVGRVRVGRAGAQLSTEKQESYIPVRPLKEERNQLFSIGAPSALSLSAKLLIFTPCLAVSLDGVANEWTNWRVGAAVLLLWAGLRVLRLANFVKAQQVSTLKTNRDLSRFYLTLPHNRFSARYEQILLENEKRTFEQKFKENLRNRTLELSEDIYAQLDAASEADLANHIAFLKSVRQGVVLELARGDIAKFEFVSEREARRAVRQELLRLLVGRRAREEVLEEYSALKEERTFVLITTRPFKQWHDRPLRFFLNFANNSDKKYEEYLRALAEGKRIVEP